MSEQAKQAPGTANQAGGKAHTDANGAGTAGANGAASPEAQARADEAEPEIVSASGAVDAAYVAELEGKVAEGRARLDATLAQYKEALDEFQSVKARLTRDVGTQVRAGKKSLLVGLLEVVDNLERALDAARQDEAQADTPLCQGVTMVRDQFHAKLTAIGVQKQEAQGQMFDPAHFEAISQVPVASEQDDGRVVGVMRDAYLLEGETLRHGIVAVGKYEAKS